jgi:guanine deaminase
VNSEPKVDILIKNGRVLRSDGIRPRLDQGALIINAGIIADFVPEGNGGLPAAHALLDAENGIVLPGLVNAHTHSPENLLRGHGDRLLFDEWISAIYARLDTLPPQLSRLAVLAGAREMIKVGTTGVVDHLRRFPMTEETLQAVVSAYADVGMTACVPVMLRDANDAHGHAVDSGHLRDLPTPEHQIAVIRNAVPDAAQRGVRLGLGPSAPHRCSDGMLGLIAEISEREGLAIHTHVDESALIAEAARRRFGHSTTHELEKRGMLGPLTALAHCVAITSEDRVAISRHGALVVHNPLANMRLASGTCDITALVDAGACIALGTDGAASNDGQNMWESAKLAAFLTRRPGTNPNTWVDTDDVLAMATRHGDLVLLGPSALHSGGYLMQGAPADIAVFDDDIPSLRNEDLSAGLILGSTSRMARHVISKGRILMQDRVLMTIDEDELRSELSNFTI